MLILPLLLFSLLLQNLLFFNLLFNGFLFLPLKFSLSLPFKRSLLLGFLLLSSLLLLSQPELLHSFCPLFLLSLLLVRNLLLLQLLEPLLLLLVHVLLRSLHIFSPLSLERGFDASDVNLQTGVNDLIDPFSDDVVVHVDHHDISDALLALVQGSRHLLVVHLHVLDQGLVLVLLLHHLSKIA